VIVQKMLMRLLVAIGLWIILIAGCFFYSFLRSSSLAYVGLALLYLWYVYIPVSLAAVSIVWCIVQRTASRSQCTLEGGEL
jgi:hypothetical protein